MGRKIVENDGWDWSLSSFQKKIIAVACVFTSWLIWGLFSTPNTLDFCLRFSKSISVLTIPWFGIVLGLVAGLAFSICEKLFTYLWVWKWVHWFVIGILICGTVSVLATLKYSEVGHQEQNIKLHEIQSANKVISDLEQAIQDERVHRDDYDREAADYENKLGFIPSYISKRQRESQERLAELQKQLIQSRSNEANIRKSHGAIVGIDELGSNSKKASISIAIILEALIIILDIIGIGIYRSSSVTLSVNDVTPVNKSVTDVTPKGCNVTPVTPVTVTPQPVTLGFQFSDNITDSQEVILTMYDEFKKHDDAINISKMAHAVGRSRPWVYRTLEKYRNYIPPNKKR